MESNWFVSWDDFMPGLLRCGCPVCRMNRSEVIAGAGEALQKAIQSSLDAHRGQDPGSVCIKGGQEALDQRGNEPADAGHEGEA